jgi:hypothetical protein
MSGKLGRKEGIRKRDRKNEDDKWIDIRKNRGEKLFYNKGKGGREGRQ